MVQGSRGTRLTSSTLIRLLAQLAEVDVPESKQALAEGLSQWLRWTDAISLSAALDGRPLGTPRIPSGRPPAAGTAESDFIRVRTTLVNSIVGDFAVPVGKEYPRGVAQADFSVLRRRYTAKQQAMETSITALRSRLRDVLASVSPSLAQLAAVDAVMDQVLGVQERAALSTVPMWLDKHFQRLREALAHEEPDEAGGGSRRAGRLDVFHEDMQAILLAELDIRLQPTQGLLDALRMRQPGRNE
ncbi:MAG TPA: DUF3348 domain-containing protein [Burkholderiaceae bacterium]|jgi:hypothetical protein